LIQAPAAEPASPTRPAAFITNSSRRQAADEKQQQQQCTGQTQRFVKLRSKIATSHGKMGTHTLCAHLYERRSHLFAHSHLTVLMICQVDLISARLACLGIFFFTLLYKLHPTRNGNPNQERLEFAACRSVPVLQLAHRQTR
jgi:hypothetical protein